MTVRETPLGVYDNRKHLIFTYISAAPSFHCHGEFVHTSNGRVHLVCVSTTECVGPMTIPVSAK